MENGWQVGHRKIQKIRSAQYINLPKMWTVNNQTKQGDVVRIRLELDGSLNISLVSCQPPMEKRE